MTSDETRLGDLVQIVRGVTYLSKKLHEPGPYLLGLGSIKPHGGFRSDKLKTYGGETKQKHICSPGDVYASLKDVTQSAELLGAVARIPDGYSGRLSQDTVRLEPSSKSVDMSYIYWMLMTPQYRDFCFRFATGVTTLGLQRKDFLNFLIPNKTHTRTLIHDVLEDIEKLDFAIQAASSVLTKMTSGLFRSWFIDFDPVNAKAEGKLPYNMNEETAALFPDSFEDSEIGLIPRGWKLVKLGDVSSVCRGLSYKGAGLCDEGQGIPMMNMGSVLEGGGVKASGMKYYNMDFKPHHFATRDDVLVVNTSVTKDGRLIGSAAIPDMHDRCLFTHHLYKIKPQIPALSSRFVCELINASRQGVAMWASGTTVDNIPARAVGDVQFVLPPEELLGAFDKLAVSMASAHARLVDANNHLTYIGNAMLPRLMSGELKVLEVA